MKRSHSILKLLVLAIFLLASPAHSNGIPGWLESFWMPDPLEPGAQWWRETTNQNALAQYYNDIYPQVPHVETVAPGVYVVRGIGKSNAVALVGSTEWVLIDSMESPTNMEFALLLLRPYICPSPSPYKLPEALIYTSEDYAHYSGSSKVAPFYYIPVYASAEFAPALMAKFANPKFIPYTLRITSQTLPENPDWRIGPATVFAAFPFHTPTQNELVSGRTSLTLAGFNITLIPAVSAADAGLLVWLPDHKVLIAGDAWSPSFPDIGPLTGPGRPVQDWATTLNAMLALNPDYMVPTHGPVISSNEEIQSILTNYRVAMQYVYGGTLDLISQGLSAEDAAVLVQLPEPLASDPYLQQFIADIPSAVKGIYHQDVWWFNGEPPELASSLTTARRVEIMLELGNEMEYMLETASNTELIADDLESAEKALLMAWATYQTAPDNILANRIYIQALKKNAYMQRSNQIRNYYLSVAKEVERTMPTDTAPPVITITAPANGAYYKSSSLPAGAYTVTETNPYTVAESGYSSAEGSHTYIVTATDAAGNTGSASVTYTVDNTPPTITGMSANPSVLWPPNQKIVDVTVNYNTTDNCGQPACQISSVTCNEPISSSDFTILDAHHVRLSADRLGSGNGRIYTITVTCTDASGNSSSQAAKVTVPHDQGKK